MLDAIPAAPLTADVPVDVVTPSYADTLTGSVDGHHGAQRPRARDRARVHRPRSPSGAVADASAGAGPGLPVTRSVEVADSSRPLVAGPSPSDDHRAVGAVEHR